MRWHIHFHQCAPKSSGVIFHLSEWWTDIKQLLCFHLLHTPITPSLKLFKLWTMWSCKHTFSALGARSLIQVSCKACSAVYLFQGLMCSWQVHGRFTKVSVQYGTETLIVKCMSEWLWHDSCAVQMMTSWCRLLSSPLPGLGLELQEHGNQFFGILGDVSPILGLKLVHALASTESTSVTASWRHENWKPMRKNRKGMTTNPKNLLPSFERHHNDTVYNYKLQITMFNELNELTNIIKIIITVNTITMPPAWSLPPSPWQRHPCGLCWEPLDLSFHKREGSHLGRKFLLLQTPRLDWSLGWCLSPNFTPN